MILKSYIIEKNLNVLDEYDAVLLYGENDGIKADIKIKIKSTNKDSEIINFFEDEIIRDRDILYKNIVNESLFNEKKIIFLQSATDKIYNEVCECLEKINRNTKCISKCQQRDEGIRFCQQRRTKQTRVYHIRMCAK